MIGKNWHLVTYDPVEFENEPVEVQDYRKNTDHFRGIYRIYPQFNKGKPEDVNMQPVGLGNTRISTGYAQNSPWSLVGSGRSQLACYQRLRLHGLTSRGLGLETPHEPARRPIVWSRMELIELSSLEHWWRDQPSEPGPITRGLTIFDSSYKCSSLRVTVPSVWEHKTGSVALHRCVGGDRHAEMVMIVMKMVKLKGHLRIPALFPILFLIFTATLLLPSTEAAASGFTVSGRHLLRNDDGTHFFYIITSTCIAYCFTPGCYYSLDDEYLLSPVLGFWSVCKREPVKTLEGGGTFTDLWEAK